MLVALIACGKAAPAAPDPVIQDFRITEHTTLSTFNDLLHEQKANHIDEHELADGITTKVLPPWRKLRARVESATPPAAEREVYVTLQRYLAERQTGWEAYAAALTADSDEHARPHYDIYHQQTDAATADARLLATAFRELALPPLP